MGPSRAERRRENFILWHILVISILFVIGLWGFFGVLPSLGEMSSAYWVRAYWDSEDEAEKVRALEHLLDDSSDRASRVFSNAQFSRSPRLRQLSRQWFDEHGAASMVEPSW